MNDITSTITKPLAVLGENGSGYIRIWYPGHERCGKGITLTEDEGRKLYEVLKSVYE